MKDCAVIGGPSSYVLAQKIAKKLHAKYIKTELRTFPDGESKLTIHGLLVSQPASGFWYKS